MSEPGLNRAEWEAKLALIGQFLEEHGKKGTIELIGAWPIIEAGMPDRTSMDLGVWKSGSEIDNRLLRQACEAAGLDFDPKRETPERPHVQVVVPGIVQVPPHEPEAAGIYGALSVTVPPPAALMHPKWYVALRRTSPIAFS